MDNEIIFSDDFMPTSEIDTDGKIFVPVYEWDFKDGLQGWRSTGTTEHKWEDGLFIAERVGLGASGYIVVNEYILEKINCLKVLCKSPNDVNYSGRFIRRKNNDNLNTIDYLVEAQLTTELNTIMTHLSWDEGGYKMMWHDIGEDIGDIIEFQYIALGNLHNQVQSITFPKQLYRLRQEQSITLTPEILPVDAYDKTLTWKSSNEEITKVNDRGVVIGIGLGTCEITATSVNGVKGTTRVEVYDGSILHQCPMVNASGEAEYRIKELQFGDGYPQRAPDGINIDLRSYNLEFKGDNEYVQELDDFFTRHKGVKSFKWTAPDRSDQRKYVCRALKQRFINAKMRSLTVEIKESLI